MRFGRNAPGWPRRGASFRANPSSWRWKGFPPGPLLVGRVWAISPRWFSAKLFRPESADVRHGSGRRREGASLLQAFRAFAAGGPASKGGWARIGKHRAAGLADKARILRQE